FLDPSKEVVVSGIPAFGELVENGLGPYLSPLD
ncbi:MAG: hypothetical protein XD80_1463, partial [Synergistales bacterium 53_16]